MSEDEAAMHLSPEKAHYTLFPSIILRSILLFTLKSLAEAIKYYYVKHLQQKKKKALRKLCHLPSSDLFTGHAR